MNYSDIKKHQWFEILQLDYNPYNYKRYLYNTGLLVKDRKGREGRLYLQVSKNSNWADHAIGLEPLSDNFWTSHKEKEIVYKDPPISITEVNRKSIENIFKKWPPL